MWDHVQKLLNAAASTPEKAAEKPSAPPILPLMNPALPLDRIEPGQFMRFARNCPLPEFADQKARVVAIRYYRFGDDELKNYQLQIGAAKHFFVTIAEDDQGHYLSFSRALNEREQDQWFGRDALGFFTEPSTAKTIRCKIDLAAEGAWAAERYSKTVDWIEGSVSLQSNNRASRVFHYNLLVDSNGEKALEIEHDDESGENRVFVTIYRPITDLVAIEAVKPPVIALVEPQKEEKPSAALPEKAVETPLFRPAAAFSETALPTEPHQPKQRPDFRRLVEEQAEEIRIARNVALQKMSPPPPEEEQQLPSFLLERSGDYLSLDEVIPPEAERVRVGLQSARTLIERAVSRNVRVRDVLREMLGLDSAMSDEVIFELPLTDDDYRKLAMRFKLRPDHREEIRSRLQDELRTLLLK